MDSIRALSGRLLLCQSLPTRRKLESAGETCTVLVLATLRLSVSAVLRTDKVLPTD